MPDGRGSGRGLPFDALSAIVLAHAARPADWVANALNALVKLIRPDCVTEAVGWLSVDASCGDDE